MSIVNDSMIVNLQIGVWMGYRLDKSASQKVTADAGAVQDAARVNKHLIPKEALKPIVSAAGAVRSRAEAEVPSEGESSGPAVRMRSASTVSRSELKIGAMAAGISRVSATSTKISGSSTSAGWKNA